MYNLTPSWNATATSLLPSPSASKVAMSSMPPRTTDLTSTVLLKSRSTRDVELNVSTLSFTPGYTNGSNEAKGQDMLVWEYVHPEPPNSSTVRLYSVVLAQATTSFTLSLSTSATATPPVTLNSRVAFMPSPSSSMVMFPSVEFPCDTT